MKPFNPYTTELIQSGNPNLLYAPSSDGYSVYAVVFHSETEITCSCAGCEQFHLDCRHRKSAKFRFHYVPEDVVFTDAEWQSIQNRIEQEAELDEVRTLFEAA
jgi:hypothetical protein